MNRHFLSATESPKIDKSKEATNDIFARAQESLPTCYTPEFDKCFDESEGVVSTFPHCDVMNAAYDADYDRMRKMVVDVPLCPAPDPVGGLIKLLVAGVIGAGLGFLIPRPK